MENRTKQANIDEKKQEKKSVVKNIEERERKKPIYKKASKSK